MSPTKAETFSFEKVKMGLQRIQNYAQSKGFDIDKIMKAYSIAAKLHEKQNRKTGEPYIIHPVNVALTLTEYNVSEKCIIGSLLHDVLEDSNISKDYIVYHFGNDVCKMIELLSKKMSWKTSDIRMKSSLDEIAEAFTKYPEIMLIKMSDRLDNISTLWGLSVEKQRKQILETKEILMPIFQKQLCYDTFLKETFDLLYLKLDSRIKIEEERLICH